MIEQVLRLMNINWLTTHDRFNQCALSSINKFRVNNPPGYMNETFSHAECNKAHTHCSYQKLKLPHRKTNQRLKALSCTGSSLWNNLARSLKTSVSLNAFKHNLKDYHFRKGNRKE